MAHGLGMRDQLHDHVALDEIELYAEVLIAVAGADHTLSPAEIDRVLGLGQEPEPEPSAPEPLDVQKPDDAPEQSEVSETSGPGTAAEPGSGRSGAGSGSQARIIAPVPPARDGRTPAPVLPPLHDSISGGGRTAHPLCGPFVPWRAWQL